MRWRIHGKTDKPICFSQMTRKDVVNGICIWTSNVTTYQPVNDAPKRYPIKE